VHRTNAAWLTGIAAAAPADVCLRPGATDPQGILIGPPRFDRIHVAPAMHPAFAHSEHFAVRWSDLDANRHVKNTVFSEFATHTRFRLLEAHGFDQEKFARLRFGPVMLREEIRYRRELAFGNAVVVNVLFSGLSEDGSQWRVQQEVARSGKQAAVLTIDGAWIHLDSRKLIAPPPELLTLLQALPRAGSFEVLRSMLRNAAAAK
jgi:acyl-CoA thioester hydrolase